MRRALDAIVLVFVAALVSSCERAEHTDTPGERIVATVGGRPLTAVEVNRASRGSGAPTPPDAALENAIATRLAADEARRLGLQPNRKADSARSDDQALEQALYDSVRDQIELSEPELRAEYTRNAAQYAARQVVLLRREFASEAAARAAGPLAAEESERIGPAPIESLPAHVLPEALTLVSPGQRVVVARDGRFAVVELIEVRAAEPLSFELARAKVERGLRLRRAQAAYQSEIERLRREAEVEIDADALAEAESGRATLGR